GLDALEISLANLPVKAGAADRLLAEQVGQVQHHSADQVDGGDVALASQDDQLLAQIGIDQRVDDGAAHAFGTLDRGLYLFLGRDLTDDLDGNLTVVELGEGGLQKLLAA